MRLPGETRSRPWLWAVFVSLSLLLQSSLVRKSLVVEAAACVPQSGCDVAYAYYEAQANETLASVGAKFQASAEEIRGVNPGVAVDGEGMFVAVKQGLYVPFKCECLQNELYHAFDYQVQRADDIESITSTVFEDLSQKNWVAAWNSLAEPNFILTGADLKIPVKCFCGDPSVSLSYGLFLTYVLNNNNNNNNNLSSLASEFNMSEALLQTYNPGVNWNDSSQAVQYAFLPMKDKAGYYPPFSFGSSNARDGITTAGIVAGVAIGVGAALAFLSLLALGRRCMEADRLRTQQRLQLEKKLKSLEVDPVSSPAYNSEMKV